MPATGGGLDLPQVAPRSLLKLQSGLYIHPRAAATNFIVASVDPTGLTVGDSFTLQTAVSGVLLASNIARRPTITVNDDDAGGGLSVTVRIKGYWLGIYQEEDITATSADTNDTTVVGTKLYTQFLAPQLIAKTSDTGDAVLVGVDADAWAPPFRVRTWRDVKSIVRDSTTTEQTPVALSSTTVQVAANGCPVFVTGTALAAADTWKWVLDARGDDGWAPNGAMAG